MLIIRARIKHMTKEKLSSKRILGFRIGDRFIVSGVDLTGAVIRIAHFSNGNSLKKYIYMTAKQVIVVGKGEGRWYRPMDGAYSSSIKRSLPTVPPAQHNDDRVASKWRMFTRCRTNGSRSDRGRGGLSDVYCGLFDSNDRCYFLVLVAVRTPPPSSVPVSPLTYTPALLHTTTAFVTAGPRGFLTLHMISVPDSIFEVFTERVWLHQ